MFTSEQLDLIQEMIDHAVQSAIDDLNWERDIEDAVQGAQSETQHNVDMLSNAVDDIERRLSDVERNGE